MIIPGSVILMAREREAGERYACTCTIRMSNERFTQHSTSGSSQDECGRRRDGSGRGRWESSTRGGGRRGHPNWDIAPEERTGSAGKRACFGHATGADPPFWEAHGRVIMSFKNVPDEKKLWRLPKKWGPGGHETLFLAGSTGKRKGEDRDGAPSVAFHGSLELRVRKRSEGRSGRSCF